jgi:predicted permease
MGSLSADIRFAFRGFFRNPLFTTVAVASLALGLGANTAIFSLLDQVILRPLPVRDASRLVLLESPGPNQGRFSGDNSDRLFSFPAYLDLRNNNQAFDGLIARFQTGVSVGYKGASEFASAELVSGNYFEVLGVQPAAGRLFSAADDVLKGGHPLVVLSHGLWTRRFGADPRIVGQTIRLNNSAMTVIGIAPKRFFGVNVGSTPDVYVPLTMKAQATPTWDMLEERSAHYLHLLGKLKPGMSREQAQASLQPVFKAVLDSDLAAMSGRDISETFRKRFLAKAMLLRPAQNGVPTYREQSGTPVKVLMAMVGLVLLIACANVANLLMARALGRQKEIAIRLSMGASRTALIRQFVVESVALFFMGAGLGLIVSAWTSDLLIRSVPSGGGGKSALTETLDERTLLFCLALTLVTGVLFGLIPALQATRPDVNTILKEQAAGVVGGFGHLRSRQALVIAQVALSLLLLVGAGLFTRSLINLRSLDPGFKVSNLAMFTVDAAANGYAPERTHRLYEDIQLKIAAIPGVRAVTASDLVLLSGDQSSRTIHVAGYQAKSEEDMNPQFISALPGYFNTLGIGMLEGRDFTSLDRKGARKVAIVNETFARYFFKNESAVGRMMGTGSDKQPTDIEIVGVVRDGKYNSLRNEKMRLMYLPVLQDEHPGTITFVASTVNNPESLMRQMRRTVAGADPALALWDLKTMESQVAESLYAERMIAVLCACFGALATILAAVGLYGVTAYSVARRTREIGIRMALGAGRDQMLRVVLQEVAILCIAGVGIGLPVSIALGGYVRSQLYGVKPADPLTLALAVLILIGVSLAGGIVPARRAASVDPMIALRYE